MKKFVSAFVVLSAMATSAFAGTLSFSKDFIVSTVLSVDDEPGKKITIQPYETFSNTGYGRDGISAFPTFRLVFTHPGRHHPSGYQKIEPEQLNIFWEGPCEYGAKVFKGEMISYEVLRVVMSSANGKISIHGVGTVVGDCN